MKYSDLGVFPLPDNPISSRHDSPDLHQSAEMPPIDVEYNSGAVNEVPVRLPDPQHHTSTTTPVPTSSSTSTAMPFVRQPVVVVPHLVNSKNYSISVSVENSWCMRLSFTRLCVSDEQRTCTFLPYGGPKPDSVDSRSVDPRRLHLVTRDRVQFDRVCRQYHIYAAKGSFDE